MLNILLIVFMLTQFLKCFFTVSEFNEVYLLTNSQELYNNYISGDLELQFFIVLIKKRFNKMTSTSKRTVK